jgi:hypothetical protein
MSLSIPIQTYDLAAFGLLVVVSLITFIMVMIRLNFHRTGRIVWFPRLMGEDNKMHTALYVIIFLAVLSATILICAN